VRRAVRLRQPVLVHLISACVYSPRNKKADSFRLSTLKNHSVRKYLSKLDEIMKMANKSNSKLTHTLTMVIGEEQCGRLDVA